MSRKYGSQNYKKWILLTLRLLRKKKVEKKKLFENPIFENKDEECKEWGIHMYFNNGPPKMATNGMQE